MTKQQCARKKGTMKGEGKAGPFSSERCGYRGKRLIHQVIELSHRALHRRGRDKMDFCYQA